MPSPKRHHYLPRFYLEYFCRGEFLWVFDREKRTYRQQTPANTAVQKHYYRFEEDEGKKNSDLEGVLSQIEGAAKPIFEKIEKRAAITADDKAMLSMFIAALRARSPEFEESVNEAFAKFIKSTSKRLFASEEQAQALLKDLTRKGHQTRDVTPRQMVDFVQRDEYDIFVHRNESLKAMLLAIKHSNYFLQMDWLLICAPAESSFVTTDNPFIVLPPPDHKPKTPFGFLTPGTRKIIPLSQKTCLMVFDKGDRSAYHLVSKQQVQAINLNVTAECNRYVIARNELLLRNLVKRTKIEHRKKSERFKFSWAFMQTYLFCLLLLALG